MLISTHGKWEADAGNISDFGQFETFVYRNGSVDSFLNDKGKSFVIAAKGIGKTLLLSYKRYLLEKEYRRNESLSLTFIPTQHPYISFIESIKSNLSNEHLNCLQKWEYCSKLWALVIELCIISYSDIDKEKLIEELPNRANRHKVFLYDLVKRKNSIEYIFNELICLNESTLTKLINDVANYIGESFSLVHQGMILFFDRFDNALETSHDEIWTSIQTGLMEAAWNVMRSNHHVKLYLSIRQEAYASHRSRNKNAISTSVIKVEYTRAELKELVNHLVQYYEGIDSIEQFLGFDNFPNTVTFKDENVFDFMYRYSIGRPRDFVQFCGDLSRHKNSYTNLEDKRMGLKERVRYTSSDTIIDSLFEELRMLMECLKSVECFRGFLTHLRHNILKYSDLQIICRQFNGEDCDKKCKNCEKNKHPFCDLYNMGLLGIVEKTAPGVEKRQRFKTPYEDFTYGLRGNVDYFLIHPALREYINNLHRASDMDENYELYLGILVGDQLEWTDEDTKRYYMNKWIREIKTDRVRVYYNNLLTNYVKELPINEQEVYYPERNSLPLFEKKTIEPLVDLFITGEIKMPKPISVFVSYAYDSKAHKQKVESFVNMLRQMGFDAEMDSLLKARYPDLDQLMTYGLSRDKVIVVLSPEYKRKADNFEGGVWKEFKMVADDLEKNPKKYIFVSFDPYTNALKEKISPSRIGNRWVVDLDKGRSDHYNELISFIKEEKEYPFSDVNPNVAKVTQIVIKPF